VREASIGLQGVQNQIGIVNRFLIENVVVGAHCQSAFRPLFCFREFCWGDPSEKNRGKLKGVAAEKSARATADHVRR
jgi:hypothetical protein